jgi:DNA-binding winged helix-turn-helix (wHTH) protein
MLLEHPGEVVSREELQTKLWPVDTFVDFDHSLNAAIKRLRDALGDAAEKPIFIETLARRGYRFIVPVERLDDGGHFVQAVSRRGDSASTDRSEKLKLSQSYVCKIIDFVSADAGDRPH